MRVMRHLPFLLMCALMIQGCQKSGGGDEQSVGGCGLLGGKVYNGESCSDAPRSAVVELIAIGEIREDRAEVFTCTATLISHDKILTSAHCFESPIERFGADATFGVLFAGEEPRDSVAIGAYAVHPDYDGEAGSPYDVAIGTLTTSPPSAVRPFSFLSSERTKVGDRVTAFGYGISNGGAYGELKAADLVVEAKEGGNLIALFGSAEASLCQGDSGGPLVVQREGVPLLVGVNSFVDVDEKDCARGAASISGFVDLQNRSVINFIRDEAGDIAEE